VVPGLDYNDLNNDNNGIDVFGKDRLSDEELTDADYPSKHYARKANQMPLI